MRNSISSHSCQNLVFFLLVILRGIQPSNGFHLFWLMTKDAKHLFMCLLPSVYSLQCNICLCLAHFLVVLLFILLNFVFNLFFFILLNFESSSYILDTSPLLNVLHFLP